MSSNDIDINAADHREHVLQLTRTISRAAVAVIAIVSTAILYGTVASRDEKRWEAEADAKTWKARYLECHNRD